MDRLFAFKNFALGTEIDIAGTFIYNGIREFNKMNSFFFESEIFSFLYHVSVGIERLQKVLIVLLENPNERDVIKLEKELITHSHQDLHNRICKNKKISFTTVQNDFLRILTSFYKSCRYDRFSFGTDFAKERRLLCRFISNHLNIRIETDMIFPTRNDDKIKEFIGRVVGSISRKYYAQIREQSDELNLYTYELRYESPAQKIFLPKFIKESVQEQYVNEQIALKELLIYLTNTKDESPFYSFLKDIEPLEFDIALLQEHISELCIGKISQQLIDEVESMYQEFEIDIGERLEMLRLIGNPGVLFDIPEDNME